ncbi:MAG: glycine--tRNA ligase subunit alpha [Chlamydiae bacterium]|nr:glycine--tRNA ligase subunit alpha [Chlamydiota bacterium]MBI3266412.1 glycine--tRNA ligase subunit alpha [Chlamydiota bacterium]
MTKTKSRAKTFTLQEMILCLESYWSSQGCVLGQAYDVEVGAGTSNPLTFFKVLGSDPWRVAYVQPSRRPADGRYGDNPNRVYQHHQYQVILKPAPFDVQDLYLASLEAIGIDPYQHDIRFVEDDWESPSLGANGLGWEVWCDGMEITQFTYFQQMGGIELHPISVELTYGLERIAMYLQNVENVFDLKWNEKFSYGELRKQWEYEFSRFNFEEASAQSYFHLFDEREKEAKKLLELGLVFPAYDSVLKCSHIFNILDSRRAISVTERTGFITRIRGIAKGCAQKYLENQNANIKMQN